MVSVQYAVAPSPTVPAPKQLRQWVRAALQGRRAGHELCLRIVDETEMAALNGTYRGKQEPTNVLSFPVDALPGVEPALLGDMAICAPVLAREAQEQGKKIEAHWAHIVIHGTLHLMGYDHQQRDDARHMEGLERELLASLGYPDPYLVRAVESYNVPRHTASR